MGQDTLFVSKRCPASRRAVSMIANAPTAVQKSVNINEVTGFSNTPQSVTAVPTLLKQNGQMLVGAQVFRYLEKMRQEPNFPQTPEMSENFLGANLSMQNILFMFLAIMLVVLALVYFSKAPPLYW